MHDFEVRLRSDPALLKAVRGMVKCYVESAGFDHDKAQEIVLAVDEACTNAIRHAYDGDCDCAVWLTLNQEDGWTRIEVRDDGNPAPLERIEKKMEDRSAEEQLVPGGLGVPLMRHVFDQVSFTPGERRGNVIALGLKNPDRKAS